MNHCLFQGGGIGLRQRVFALLLTAAMLPGILPTAYAADAAEEITIGEESSVSETEAKENPADTGVASIELTEEPMEQTVTYTDTLGTGIPAVGRISTSAVQVYDTADSGFVDQLDIGSRAVYEAIHTEIQSGEFTFSGGWVTIRLEEGNSALSQLSTALEGDSGAEIKQQLRGLICDAYAAYNYDHPEVFWIGKDVEQENSITITEGDSSYTAEVSAVTLRISSPFDSLASISSAKQTFENGLNAAVTAAKQGRTAYQKLRLAHDYLCSTVTYTSGAAWAYSAYGALADKKAVCEGYSRAMKVVCDRLGIPCCCISGTGVSNAGSVNHMWNAVSLDSRWYAVDCTWDDTAGKASEDSSTLHTFFLVGRNTAAAELGLGKFSETHRESGRLYDGTGVDGIKTFAYPALSTAAYTGEHSVDAIKLSCGSELRMKAGEKQTIRLTLYPESAPGVKLVWKTSNKNVATVAASGSGSAVVTAVGGGTAVISVTADGITVSCTVKVTPKLSTPKLTSVVSRVGGVQVNWARVDGATGYRICRRTSGSSWSGTGIATVTGGSKSSYTDYSVKNNTKYTYTVYAMYDGEIASRCSTDGKSAYYLQTPEILTITNRSDGIRLTWKSISKATSYNIYRKSPKDTKWTKIASCSSKATSYTDKKVSNHYTYIYTMRAVNSKGMSYYHTAGSTLRRISQVQWSSLKSRSRKTLTARWKRVSYVTGYELQYSKKSSMQDAKTIRIKSSSSSVLSKTVSKLTGGKTYYVRIRAYKSLDDGKTYGAWSSTKRVTVKR